MAKSSRKQSRHELIERELRKREEALAVPAERQVYVLRQHQNDEGGPRPLCPREFAEGCESFDFDAWRTRLARAPAGWEPPEMVPDRDVEAASDDCCEAAVAPQAKGVRDERVGDFSMFSDLMVFSRRAIDLLEPLLKPCGVLLPLRCELGDYAGFRLDAEVDALDRERTSASWRPTSNSASSIYRYGFHTERLGSAALFRVPEHFSLLVLREFVDRVRGADLSGFRFYRVWPNAGPSFWWWQDSC